MIVILKQKCCGVDGDTYGVLKYYVNLAEIR